MGVAARRVALMERVYAPYGDRVRVWGIDVCSAEAEAQVEEALQQLGRVDLYCHVSGLGRLNARLEAADERLTVQTNALGFVACVSAAFRYMERSGGGHIAAVTSVAGTAGLAPAASYSATKALQHTYLEALEQLAAAKRLDIHITDVRPGFVRTDFLGDKLLSMPLLLSPERTAAFMLRAIERRRRVVVIDGRWRVVVWCWRCIPRVLWRLLGRWSGRSSLYG